MGFGARARRHTFKFSVSGQGWTGHVEFKQVPVPPKFQRAHSEPELLESSGEGACTEEKGGLNYGTGEQ